MWILKIKFTHPNSFSIQSAKKFNLTLLAFPLNTFQKLSESHMTSAHLVIGEKKQKQKWEKLLRKTRFISNLEVEGDLVVYTHKAPIKESHLALYFSPELFLVKPVAIKPDGYQYIEVASWRKEVLTKFVKDISSFGKIHSQSIKQEKLTDIYIPHLFPSLSPKQKEVILLAFSNGYYTYPKGTDIDMLAKALKLAPSTVQEHLRKAEAKLMPFLLENLTLK